MDIFNQMLRYRVQNKYHQAQNFYLKVTKIRFHVLLVQLLVYLVFHNRYGGLDGGSGIL